MKFPPTPSVAFSNGVKQKKLKPVIINLPINRRRSRREDDHWGAWRASRIWYNIHMTFYRIAKYSFITLVFLGLLTPFLMFQELLFPYVAGKAFFFRSIAELALPFYIYLAIKEPNLRPNLKHPLTLLVLIFLAINIISAVFGVDFTKSFWGMFERMDSVFTHMHWVLLYFYILLLGRLDGKWLERFLYAFIVVSSITALNGISGYMGGPMLMPDRSLPVRASSTFGNPIFFASFLILPMALSAFFAAKAERLKPRIFFWTTFALQLLAVIFSVTRGAVLGLIVGAFLAGIVYVIFQKNRKIKLVSAGILGPAAIVAVLLFAFPQVLPQSAGLRRLFSLKDTNTQARLIQWRVAINGVKDFPVLGAGPNNYYFISNKYYNPEIWKYDREWFDKPHNYQLEILVTNGILGFAAYLGVIFAALWVLYKAFKAGVLGLLETCLLLAGFFAYQIQNFFVFDTVSASLAFYVFLGFIGFLWSELKETPRPKTKLAPSKNGLAQAAVWAGVPIMLYAVYAFNISGAQISRNLNFAKLFKALDFDEAKMLLDKSAGSPFNFYLKDTAYEYSNFAAWWSNRNQEPAQLQKSKAMMEDAMAINRRAVTVYPNDPTVWLKLANTMLAQSHLENAGFNQEAYDAAFKAHELSLKKHDPKLFMATTAIEGKKPELAEPWLLEVLADYPDLQDARWQLANIYYFSGRQDEAKDLAEFAVSNGYKVDKITKGDWLITYYYDRKQPQKALEFLLAQALDNEKNSEYFARLADAYNKNGRYAEARAAALKVLELDPASKAEVEAFLKGLPK